ncbi:Cell division protein ZipA [Helicobacter suis]|uniref:SPOR domain-containing protein n=1 Tax=Helicobacter suis TaxID=104628 RepID=UPI00158139EA|nr:SPOR domain-containing protein [Helicobacter suis]BCD47157.1 Cell division protein ZipA [Helicobacter suis]GFK17066.1 Cell division protein ZipA [Helicobacter suis]
MDNNELNKELNKRLNDLVEEEKGSGLKKVLLIVAIGLIVLVVVLVVFYKSTREPAKSALLPPDKGMQKVGNTADHNANNFESLNLEPTAKKPEEDKFDQIVKDIQAKQKPNPQDETKLTTLPASPLDKPAQPTPPPTPPLQKPTPMPIPPTGVNNPHQQNHAKENAHAKTQIQKTEHEKNHATNHHQVVKKEHPKTAHSQATTHNQATTHKKIPHKHHVAEKTATATHHTSTAQAPHQAPHKEVAKTTPPPHLDKPTLPKGFYLQVGVFSKTPNPKFLEAIKKYPHQVQDVNGQKRYLIGPYSSKEQADAEIDKITDNLAKPVHVQIK